MSTARTGVLAIVGVGMVVASGYLAAGPLSPPAGPVASTYKTLAEVEPRIAINATNTPGDANSLYKITQPGSYYLTGNITGVAGKHGIEIAASGVSLDLNGFDLVGVAGMGAFDGVSVGLAGRTNLTIRNGSVRGWGRDGINCADLLTLGGCVEDIAASGNAARGIATGSLSSVTGCTAVNNGGHGIESGGTSTLRGCTAYDNGGNGIDIDIASTILNCTASNNGGSGVRAGSASTLTGCVAYFNTGDGIGIISGCTLSACTAGSNQAAGFFAIDSCTFVACTSRGNDGHGIVAGASTTVLDSTVTQNDENGIDVGADSSVRKCTSQSNGSHGIITRGHSQVLENNCIGNGQTLADGAGVRVEGNDGRIEANHCATNDIGVRVIGAGNFVVRNTCQGNPGNNFNIAANNRVGILAAPPFSPAINGSTGGLGVGSTDPNANYAY
jgi:parallel beta-helix repeat protein